MLTLCRGDYMFQKRFLFAFVTVVAFILSGCYNSAYQYDEVIVMSTKESQYEDNLQFMMNTYGFDYEELQGVDLEKFINDYELRTRAFSSERVHKILLNERDMYVDDGTTALFAIFKAEGGGVSDAGDINRIGFYCNTGTLVQQVVFNLEKGEFYVDDANPHSLTQEQVSLLTGLVAKWNVASWDSHYEGEEEPSTGNFRWKLVFEHSNGEYSVYDGYTQDMSHLPETFSGVNQDLQSVIKTAK